jgi:acetolactate synthase regulatory subunit
VNKYTVEITFNRGNQKIQIFVTCHAYESTRAIQKIINKMSKIRDIKNITVCGCEPVIRASNLVF